ncbi:GAF domain-containing protein [Neosynechococcus sphagnicola]|uniref:hybrid sensor histidine kinase/response regulator n=1 Tax=Neosynechococcus sphagnicola TaxID=1501145 RepID=UPI00068DDB29|nr:GAF domain-containing protein [Neosynechococcus sphagnicola]
MSTLPVPPDSALILVVDDDAFTRRLLRMELERAGHQVIEAENGEAGLRLFCQCKPEIVLLDALMPVMDGFTCCSHIQALPGGDRTPVLMITGLEDQRSVDQAFAAGATDYVTKPIHLPVLRQRVRRLLQTRYLTEELRQQSQREYLLRVVAQQIHQSLNLDEILNTTVDQVRQLLQTDRVVIYHCDAAGNGMVAAESVAAGWVSILGTTIRETWFQERIAFFRQGHREVSDNLQQSEVLDSRRRYSDRQQIRAQLVVPIQQGEHFWGILSVHHCAQPHHWQGFEINLLEQLVTQVEIAVQQSELYQQVQRLNTDLEQQVEERTTQLKQAFDFEALIKRITDKVRDSLDEDQILQTAVQELGRGLDIYCCNAALYDLEGQTATISYEYTSQLPSAQGETLKMADLPEIYGQLLQNQCFQFSPIAATLPCALQPQFTALVCPIFDDQGVLGDLWLLKPPEAAFSELEIRVAQQVANQGAIALRQARLYQAAQVQVQELERLNRLKDDFLSTVSHELRSPMTNIKMASQLLATLIKQEQSLTPSLPLGSPISKIDRYLQILNTECDREMALINDLLDLQQLEAGVDDLDLSDIDLHGWLPQIGDSFRERAITRQQTLRLEIATNLPLLRSSAVNLGRVVSELLHNACKYTPAGETILLTAHLQGDTLQIGVSNAGVEIPAHELPRIFDKFYRVPSADPWKQGGTGLGLALVQKMVSHLGGRVEVESHSLLTSFTVVLPLKGPGKPLPRGSPIESPIKK